MQTQKIKRRPQPIWLKEYESLVPVLTFTVITRRILIFALIATLSGIVLRHFTRLPDMQLRWAALLILVAWLGVEIYWKCLSAYHVGRARAGWMKTRSALVNALGDFMISVDKLQECTVGKVGSWITPVQNILASVSGHVQSIHASVKVLDESLAEMEAAVGSGPFLAVRCSETLATLPQIWERFSSILPDKVRSEAFRPAFNDMLKDYMGARKFLENTGRRWLAFAFTMWAICIVLDCIRVMLTSGMGRIFLAFLPESLRAWWRRQ